MNHSTPPSLERAKQPPHDETPQRDLILTHHEAEVAAPMDVAICGEEDPGAALESLVMRDEKTPPNNPT